MAGAYEHVYLPISTDLYYKISDGTQSVPVDAMVTEVSSSGLKFITPEKIKPNSMIDITVFLDKKKSSFSSKSRVLWQRQVCSLFLNDPAQTGSLHNTAIVFTDFDADKKKSYDSYIHKFSEKIASNRAHARLPLVLDAKFSKNPQNLNTLYDCVIGDIGIEGIKLYVIEEIKVGEKLAVVFDLPDGFGHMEISGQVVRRIEAKNLIWALGIEFYDIRLEQKEMILEFISSRLT
jgi:hypothetical protein